MFSALVIKFVLYLLHNSKGAFCVGGVKALSHEFSAELT